MKTAGKNKADARICVLNNATFYQPGLYLYRPKKIFKPNSERIPRGLLGGIFNP